MYCQFVFTEYKYLLHIMYTYIHLHIYHCSKVDNNEAYDNLDVLDADAEEKYFDDEDPESIHSDSSNLWN